MRLMQNHRGLGIFSARKTTSDNAGSQLVQCFRSLVVFWLFVLLAVPVNIESSASTNTTKESTLTTQTIDNCPLSCDCLGPEFAIQADCSNRSLTAIPKNMPEATVKLYLSDNNISSVDNYVFAQVPQLNELILANNNITDILPKAFFGLTKLKSLSLQNNKLKEISSPVLEPLASLEVLHLDGNQLRSVPAGNFQSLRRLQHLWLNGNQLHRVPSESLEELTELEALNLGDNKIQVIPDYTFRTASKLVILMLHRNEIQYIESNGLSGLISLKVLEIHDNKLTEFPSGIAGIPTLRELIFSGNAITEIPEEAFRQNQKLTLLEMGGNPILDVHPQTFSNLPSLKKLAVSEARQMEHFPDLTGTAALEHLRLDRASLVSVPLNLCDRVPLLRSINLRSNKIKELPDLRKCKELRLIDISYNEIAYLDGYQFLQQSKLVDLMLSHNLIPAIPEEAFSGLQNLQVLDLMSNRITDIHPLAFANLTALKDLNVGENFFPTLPTDGLQNLRQLKTFNNKNLRDFPLPEAFPKVHSLALSYAYHCCPFRPLARRLPLPATLKETIVWLTRDEVDMDVWSTNITDVWPGYENFSTKFEEFASQLWKAFGRDHTIPDNLAQFAEEYFQNHKISQGAESDRQEKQPVQCLPEPGPFMPCEDLFGWWSLRCGVWVVFLLAMLGNGVVVIVLLFGRSKIDVPRFLVCNLAMADFFMGIYLGILAVVDASTLGEFRIYAIQWQMSAGCQIAGFLGVLSSELSVYTLAVITLERNYAITHAMHLNKRLSLKHAGYIMGGGWTFALIMAILPLFGVSDYKKFAICLPFETEDPLSMAYVVFIILINGVAFLTLMGCYLKMYWVIRGSQAWNSNDSRIAKRMALLVITDFICWAPIAFFSLTAVFGANLISLEEAKVFTIFVLPLNSCANPFLYAIFTKQFKKDCVLICKRIEESRVTRGIGRCRHSSNFSNRHTPANTNSAVDRKSGGSSDGQLVCKCGAHIKNDSVIPPKYPELQPGWKSAPVRYLIRKIRGKNEQSNSDYSRAVMTRGFIHMDANQKRQSSVTSDNFSSRSDSWRQGNIPLKLLERNARRNSWTGTQKSSSQDSNSCSRQDSSTSTFRLSRSSVSSDASGSRSIYKDRRQQQLNSSLTKPPAIAENDVTPPKIIRAATMTNIKDVKPKLCRQTAVMEDPCQSKHLITKRVPIEMLAIRPIPQYPAAKSGVCSSCGRRETANLGTRRFKSKELEEKFNCFYNRLVETSNEDSSEVNASKDDQIVSTDQSTADCKTDSGKETADTSLSEQQSEDYDSVPQVKIEPKIHKGYFRHVPPKSCSTTHPAITLPTSSGFKVPSLRTSPAIHTSEDNMSKKKSRSMSHLGFDIKLFSRRKAASDNSLKKISLKNLPHFLRSLSSQSTQSSSQKAINYRSQTQLLPHGPRPILSCQSEVTIANRSPDSSRTQVWTPDTGRRFEMVQDGDSDDADVEDDDCLNIGCQSPDSLSSEKLTKGTKVDKSPTQLPLCATTSTTSEDSPLLDKEVKPSITKMC